MSKNDCTINTIPISTTPKAEERSHQPATTPVTFGPPPQAVLSNRLVDAAGGTHRVVIYSAGSRGLANFIRPLGLTAYKLGVTSAGDAQRRVVDLRRKHYGSLFGRLDQPIEALETIEQADEWALVPWQVDPAKERRDLPPGFFLRNGVLEVEIRLDVPVETVDQAVHAMMAERALDAFLATTEGKARLRAVRRDPEGVLLTPYTLMYETVRISRVKELYLYRPQLEFPQLVACLAKILAPLMPAATKSAEAA
ncbi:MAG: hypothetical protein CTY25_07485 [Methylobacterium sp.]|nr:MAG: hypothetical protein CTY25_07485 [Methylobacterium sp.]